MTQNFSILDGETQANVLHVSFDTQVCWVYNSVENRSRLMLPLPEDVRGLRTNMPVRVVVTEVEE